MATPTKNNCPICGSKIILRDYELNSVGSSSSVALGGQSSHVFYRCEANFDTCSVSVSICDAVMIQTNQPEKISRSRMGWKDALIRRNHYDDFMADHPHLKHKILAIADDQLNIKVNWEHLIPLAK